MDVHVVDGRNQPAELSDKLSNHRTGLVDQIDGINNVLPEAHQRLHEVIDGAQQTVGCSEQRADRVGDQADDGSRRYCHCYGAELRLCRRGRDKPKCDQHHQDDGDCGPSPPDPAR